MSHLTETERLYYTSTFLNMDKDGNGYIDIEELGEFYSSINPNISFRKVMKVFRHIDANNDGKIALHEFLAVAPSIRQADKDEDTRLEQIFNRMDTNGDGFLTLNEVHTALCRKGEDIPMSKAQTIVLMMDSNGDGMIDKQELLTYNRLKIMLSRLAQ